MMTNRLAISHWTAHAVGLFWNAKSAMLTSPLGILMYSAWNPKDNYDMSASVFVVQFNGFMSLTS